MACLQCRQTGPLVFVLVVGWLSAAAATTAALGLRFRLLRAAVTGWGVGSPADNAVFPAAKSSLALVVESGGGPPGGGGFWSLSSPANPFPLATSGGGPGGGGGFCVLAGFFDPEDTAREVLGLLAGETGDDVGNASVEDASKAVASNLVGGGETLLSVAAMAAG
eukprot:m.285683 g.285683  ORF g.285683 m.285683 type:complete len:165 (-) comp19435_c1_seq6:169-663(-)